MTSPEIKEQYKALKESADVAYANAEPQRKALAKAEAPFNKIQDEIDELLEYREVQSCEGCSDPIFEGDKTAQESDGVLCENCAPTYEEILKSPSYFLNADEEPMSGEETKAFCDAHIAAGGVLTDSTAT